MTYADFGIISFFVYLGGCFTAVGLSLRHQSDNRILPQTYGLWIAAAFAAHHFLVPQAAREWHAWWYVWNMGIAAFTVLPAFMLKDADARVPVMLFGIFSVGVCGTYALFSAIGKPLPGILFFYSQSLCEASQVLSMIIWSGPVVPITKKLWHAVAQWRIWPWTQHRLLPRA